MNNKRHGTFFVLEGELFSIKTIQTFFIFFSKKSRHTTVRVVARAVVS